MPRSAVGLVGAGFPQPTARRQRQVHAVDLTADEAVRTAGHGGDDEAVGAAGHGIGAEQHASPCRLEERLHEDGDRSVAAGRATSSTASRKRSQPRTSSTDVKRPAIECEPPSSTVDDERTTSASRPESDRARHASCSAVGVMPGGGARRATARVPAVVTAKPGSTGMPAARARASADGLGADDIGTRGPISASRSTTAGIAVVLGGRSGEMHRVRSWPRSPHVLGSARGRGWRE